MRCKNGLHPCSVCWTTASTGERIRKVAVLPHHPTAKLMHISPLTLLYRLIPQYSIQLVQFRVEIKYYLSWLLRRSLRCCRGMEKRRAPFEPCHNFRFSSPISILIRSAFDPTTDLLLLLLYVVACPDSPMIYWNAAANKGPYIRGIQNGGLKTQNNDENDGDHDHYIYKGVPF